MTWVRLALLLLQLVDKIFDWARERSLIQQGVEEEIARSSAKIWEKTSFAKKVMEEVSEMDEAKVDAVLRGLERVPDNGKSG